MQALKEHAPGKEPELRPVSGTARTDLFPLYQLVAGKGGQAMITSTDEWTTIARKPTVCLEEIRVERLLGFYWRRHWCQATNGRIISQSLVDSHFVSHICGHVLLPR